MYILPLTAVNSMIFAASTD